MIDPLGWIVELAIFFHLDHRFFPVIWSVRRVTTTGCLLTIGFDEMLMSNVGGMLWTRKICTFLMAAIMIIQIILNVYKESYHVTM